VEPGRQQVLPDGRDIVVGGYANVQSWRLEQQSSEPARATQMQPPDDPQLARAVADLRELLAKPAKPEGRSP
jgi:hypothetical protein